MREALRILANVTDDTDEQLADLVREFGRGCSLHQLIVPVTVIINARKECKRMDDPGYGAA